MTVTITTKKQVEETVEIPVPCFYRNNSETYFIGVLDNDTVVKIYRGSDLLHISNSKMWLGEHELKDAIENWIKCTEQEFFDAYADVELKMSINPILLISSNLSTQ